MRKSGGACSFSMLARQKVGKLNYLEIGKAMKLDRDYIRVTTLHWTYTGDYGRPFENIPSQSPRRVQNTGEAI